MRYFITISVIFHLIVIQASQAVFKTSAMGNGYKIIEIGYIERQTRSTKSRSPKPKNESTEHKWVDISNLKENQKQEKQVKEEIILKKEEKELQPVVEEAVLDKKEENSSNSNYEGNSKNLDEALGGSLTGKPGNPFAILWFADIKNKIEKFKKYPEQARKKNIQGETLLEISFKTNGYIDSVNIYKSSGNKVLDDEAVRIIRAAEPFTPPKEIKFSKIFIRLPIRFEIKN